MNLSVKRLGQLAMLAVALFFFSCEDLSTLGFENPQQKFNIRYVDIQLPTSVFVLDSLITDDRALPNTGIMLVGKYADPALGTVTAQPYLKFVRTWSGLMPDSLKFDSVTVSFRLNLYSYGSEGALMPKFAIHEITSDTLGSKTTHFNFSSLGYNPDPVGIASLSVAYKDLQDNLALPAEQQDTIVIRARLSQEFGQRLYDNLRTVDFVPIPDTTKAQRALSLQQKKEFDYAFKGLTLVPDPGVTSVVGLNYLSAFTGIILHYHTEKAGVYGQAAYLFDYPSFTNITADRSGTELAGAINRQDFLPSSGNRYIESGAPVLTKIDLSPFYDFADQDSAKDIIINSAELIIDNISYPSGVTPHNAFNLWVLKEGNFGMDSTSGYESMLNNYTVRISDGAYFVGPDVPATAGDVADLVFNSSDNQYSTFLTRFTHILTRNLNESPRIKSLAILPSVPSLRSGVHRTIFDKNSIHLRIFYTRPTEEINPN